jgi:hypothetical protein
MEMLMSSFWRMQVWSWTILLAFLSSYACLSFLSTFSLPSMGDQQSFSLLGVYVYSNAFILFIYLFIYYSYVHKMLGHF